LVVDLDDVFLGIARLGKIDGDEHALEMIGKDHAFAVYDIATARDLGGGSVEKSPHGRRPEQRRGSFRRVSSRWASPVSIRFDGAHAPRQDRWKMKGWVGYTLLAICLFVTYQGYRNSRTDVFNEQLARSVACTVDAACILKSERPGKVLTDIVRRRYEWPSNAGSIVVTCRRRYAFFGDWQCTAEYGSLGRIE
jgi:hypothetical protein